MPKQHDVTITTQTRSHTSVEGEARRAGMGRKKGWFAWFKIGEEPQRGRPGRFAIIDKLKRRVGFGNRYKETVRDSDTGELMHHCDEPLDQHQGHGSARHLPMGASIEGDTAKEAKGANFNMRL